ncbi:nucleotidyltransferase family protein [Dechloromonas sp. XY25]|uniref:Nucleotidyltransferase family protein n=1 Tax=Dechloromonas hankyongensis TaxID=2908002 RepID=A0ABS9K3Q1_9RHOO|nr:nucleotidyltransferase family protein [Dechloromonas hankyongensis]MCG2577778.1 nucleotidyltransferase family protein [Dechloromonas hankyongensis]
MTPDHPLIHLLRAPTEATKTLSLREWSIAISAAREGHLLGRLGHLLGAPEVSAMLPEQVRNHTESANRVAASQHRNVRWEIEEIHRALNGKNIPFAILKGGAYIAMGYDAARGRTLSDIDIMVPHARIVEAERALIDNGWFPGKLNPYDQRYYRTWMHELPPLRHLERGTTLDVHHTIIPPTAAVKPDVNQLWAEAKPLAPYRDVFVLCPEDMVLHSATHLFHDGEMEHGLRDLIDMDSLIGEFARQADFWPKLNQRAVLLDLTRPLYYALQCRQHFLGVAAPEEILRSIGARQEFGGPSTQWILGQLITAIGAILHERPTLGIQFAKFMVFVRSHYLRMPMHLLAPHLLRKMLVPKQE